MGILRGRGGNPLGELSYFPIFEHFFCHWPVTHLGFLAKHKFLQKQNGKAFLQKLSYLYRSCMHAALLENKGPQESRNPPSERGGKALWQ